MLPNYQARSPFVLKHTTSLFIYFLLINMEHATPIFAHVTSYIGKSS